MEITETYVLASWLESAGVVDTSHPSDLEDNAVLAVKKDFVKARSARSRNLSHDKIAVLFPHLGSCAWKIRPKADVINEQCETNTGYTV